MNTQVPEDITRDFLSSLLMDNLEDWSPAKAYGEFLTELCPTLLIGHLVLRRAFRHLDDRGKATVELTICRNIVNSADFFEQVFLPELEQEERLLGTGAA